MAAIVDIIETRIEMTGVREFVAEMTSAAGAVHLFGGHLDDAAKKSLSFAALAGGGALLIGHELFEVAKEAGETDAAFSRAANNFKGAFSVEDLRKFAGEMEELTGISEKEVAAAVGLMGAFRISKEQAEQLTPAVLDAAESLKAWGVSREQLARQAGKAVETGEIGRMVNYGISIDQASFKAATFEQRVRLMANALEGLGPGAAAKFRNTLPGALEAAASAGEKLKVTIGEPLVGPLNKLVNVTTHWTEELTKADPVVKGLVTTVAVGAVVALGAYSIATTASVILTARYTAELLKLTKAHQANAAAATANAGATASAGAAAGGAAAKGGGKAGIISVILGALGIGAGEAGAEATAGDKSVGGGLKHIGSRALEGAAAGAIFEGVGAIPGALIGALIGDLEVMFGGGKKGDAAKDPHLTAAEKQIDLLQKLLDESQKNNSAGKGFAPKDIPVVVQRYAARGARTA